MDLKLSKEFLNQFSDFAEEFDAIAQDPYQGVKAELLAKSFLEKHREELTSIPFPAKYKYPNCSQQETFQEDLCVVNGADEFEINDVQVTVANFYRRLCQGTYMRVTFNNSRLNLDEDRNEAVNYGRFAIRYNPNDYLVCYWFLIAVGWNLDVTFGPRERSTIARIFRDIARRCIRMNEKDGLPHNLLGRYYYHVAGLSWLEKTLAKSILGAHLDGTYQDAEREIRLAHQIKDDWLPTGLWMAKVLLAQKRPMAEVREWIQFGLKLDCQEPSSEIERNQLLELDAKLKNKN